MVSAFELPPGGWCAFACSWKSSSPVNSLRPVTRLVGKRPINRAILSRIDTSCPSLARQGRGFAAKVANDAKTVSNENHPFISNTFRFLSQHLSPPRKKLFFPKLPLKTPFFSVLQFYLLTLPEEVCYVPAAVKKRMVFNRQLFCLKHKICIEVLKTLLIFGGPKGCFFDPPDCEIL